MCDVFELGKGFTNHLYTTTFEIGNSDEVLRIYRLVCDSTRGKIY